MRTPLFKYTENFTTKNWKFSDKNSDIFYISAQNIDCGYPQSRFFIRNKKNNVYLCKPQFYYTKVGWGWLGGVKVSCILCHQSVQLILAYSWARPAILVAGKGRGGMFLCLLFLHFHSCSSFFLFLSFISSTISSFSFSLSQGDDTKWPTRVDVSLNPNTINQ